MTIGVRWCSDRYSDEGMTDPGTMTAGWGARLICRAWLQGSTARDRLVR